MPPKRRAEAAEDNQKKSVNSSWFYSNVAPRVLKTIMDEFEVIQNMIDGMSGLSAEIQSVQHLAAYVDALHKTLTMVQQLPSKEFYQGYIIYGQ